MKNNFDMIRKTIETLNKQKIQSVRVSMIKDAILNYGVETKEMIFIHEYNISDFIFFVTMGGEDFKWLNDENVTDYANTLIKDSFLKEVPESMILNKAMHNGKVFYINDDFVKIEKYKKSFIKNNVSDGYYKLVSDTLRSYEKTLIDTVIRGESVTSISIIDNSKYFSRGRFVQNHKYVFNVEYKTIIDRVNSDGFTFDSEAYFPSEENRRVEIIIKMQ